MGHTVRAAAYFHRRKEAKESIAHTFRRSSASAPLPADFVERVALGHYLLVVTVPRDSSIDPNMTVLSCTKDSASKVPPWTPTFVLTARMPRPLQPVANSFMPYVARRTRLTPF